MFTGIVEELGKIQAIQSVGNTMEISIQGKTILEDMRIGDSIAVNGVCLTVKNYNNKTFQVDVMPETFHSTSLAHLTERSHVNLERSISPNGRFGGHFVTGHVDTTGQILDKSNKENAIYFNITFPKEYNHFLIRKGSIAIDGTSLTIFKLTDDYVTVSIIPHTAKNSVLGIKTVGDIVNLEFDLIGKYLYRFFGKSEEKNRISKQFLKENGFI